ncbi:MAG: hypothetical protein CVU38_14290 [Chloroflexi bacterium HGW-Chloroflexi-1]|nr:MAG: hypothetical protein CVU38_14290 [Chloroflexi bacterium HGW-Chloroflexi-1]
MTDSRRPLPKLRGRLALTLGLALTALLLAGCSLLKPAPAPDPLAEYRPALHPDFRITPTQLDSLLTYSITVQIDPVLRTFRGMVDVTIPISGPTPLRDLYFRLYPNLRQCGGNLQVTGARVDGMTVNFGYEAESTAVHLALPTPLQPGSVARAWLSFSGAAPQRGPGSYTIFGTSEDILSLTNFYPILAGRRGESWALDIADPQGDVGFHDAALYRVEVTLPPGQVIAATGAAVTQTLTADGLLTTRYVQGPAREFTLVLSPRFQVAEANALGARVRSYYLPGDALAGRSALYAAVAALEIYSDRFGPYPYREMAVVQAPLTFHGMEFPGMSLIGSQVYDRFPQELETLVVHEVAHQWWYNQVGSDQTQNPWIDEGLAEFSMYYYYQDRYGAPAAEWLQHSRWETPVENAITNDGDAPIGRPVDAYQGNYETIIYGKGALFFATLRDELGEKAFRKLMQTYLERYRWRIATPAEFQALTEEVAGRDLSGLFKDWVEGKE